MTALVSPFASMDDIEARSRQAWRPPPKLTLSQWADAEFFLSAESSAQTGRWKTLPFQKGPMDAITDPTVTEVTLMKAARLGFTKMIDAAIGYAMHQDPSGVLAIQPTVEDAKGFSKEEIDPMLRDVPCLAALNVVAEESSNPKDPKSTILHKRYPGGILSIVGANSGGGFRRISRKRIFGDEVDAYPPSAGKDGDPVSLSKKRASTFWDRKYVWGSTPLLAGSSRIERLFEEGDQRRYYVPCPQCGHMDYFVWRESPKGGHFMQWEKGKPETAHFVCSLNGCVIEHHHKRDMLERGEWRAAKPFAGHASFHLWTAYSVFPNATWPQLVAEFLAAQKSLEQLKTFINTVLGETWKEPGSVPEWERLFERSRHGHPIGKVPEGVVFLSAGVDVQKDRFVYEVVGWGAGKESWSIDAGVIMADPSREADWLKLDALLDRHFESPAGPMSILAMGIDSGWSTQHVYNWARQKPRNRVLAMKGQADARSILGLPVDVDVTHNGRRYARGCKLWNVGVGVAKAELYGWLQLPVPTVEGAPYPAGFCHFPEYGEDFFKQLTAEQLVAVTNKRTHVTKHEWHVIPNRENHALDCRVYARAAASLAGLDNRMPEKASAAPVTVVDSDPPPAAPQSTPPPAPAVATSDFRFLGNRGSGWLRRNR